MAILSYTLLNDGTSTRSDTGTIAGEWWTTAPVANIGSFFEARAIVTSESLPDSSSVKTGPFNVWVSLAGGQAWTFNTGVSGSGTLTFSLEIRNATTKVVADSSVITMAEVASGSFVESVTQSAPQYWYRLNETTGLVGSDSGSAEFDIAYLTNASSGGQDIAPSSSFTGVGSRAKTVDATGEGLRGSIGLNGQLQESFTIEFAVNLSSNNNQSILNYTDGTGSGYPDVSAGTDNQFSIQFLNTGLSTMFFGFFNASGIQTAFTIISDYASYAEGWVYCSITFDAATTTLVTKVNNVVESTVDTSPLVMRAPTLTNGRLGIFTYPDGQGTSKSGVSLDEIQMYGRVLTAGEQTEHYNFWSTGSAS